MFKELLSIYKSADDKTNLFKDQIPEDKYDAVISALETEDEAKFNDIMNAEPVSNEPVETTPVENPQEDAPAVEDTGAIVEDSTLPDGPIVDQPEVVTEDQQKVILPTIEAVTEMTNDLKVATPEDIAQLPEDVQEGAMIWKEASDDFAVKIIAETVDRFHHGDFSEIEQPTPAEILTKGAEVAKELKDAGEHKTSLTRATEDLQKDLDSARVADLIRIYGELCNMEINARDLIEDVIEKNDLAISPSKKEELAVKIIDDNIYEDATKDDMKKDIAGVITESKDYSSRDMSVQLDIFNDFSEIELDLEDGISEDTAELLESVDSFATAKAIAGDALCQGIQDNPEAVKSLDASIDPKAILDAIKGFGSKAGGVIKDAAKGAGEWISKNPGKAVGAVSGAVAAIPGAKALGETNEDDSKMDKVGKKMVGAATLAGGTLIGLKAGGAIQDKFMKGAVPAEASCGNFSEGEEAPAEEQLPQEVIDNALSNDDQIRALVEKYKMLPTVEAKDQMKADMQTLGFTDEVIAMIENYAEGNFSETKKDMSEEAPVEAPAEVCPNCGQDPCVCEAPAEEEVDVAAMVAPELFDNLLGPGVGETDPADGTLPVGEVEAPGTDIGHLGTSDQGIPAGEVVPEDDKEVTKVEIVNPEGDGFEDIMR